MWIQQDQDHAIWNHQTLFCGVLRKTVFIQTNFEHLETNIRQIMAEIPACVKKWSKISSKN